MNSNDSIRIETRNEYLVPKNHQNVTFQDSSDHFMYRFLESVYVCKLSIGLQSVYVGE